MTKPLTANFQDARLADIRQTVQQSADANLPFLLLPVRLETRFMVLDKPSGSGTQTVAEVLNGLGQLHIDLLDAGPQGTGANLTALAGRLDALSTSLGSLGPVLTKEKSWLQQLYGELHTTIVELPPTAPGVPALGQASGRLGAAIKALKVTNEKALAAATAYLTDFQQHLYRLEGFNDYPKRTPFINIKNKKDLYNYITTMLDGLTGFYTGSAAAVAGIDFIAGNQTARIEQVHAAVKAQTARLSETFARLHQDANFLAFVAQMNSEKIGPLQALFAAYEAQVLPALKAIPAPPDVPDPGLVHFEGIRTMLLLHRYNLASLKGYREVKDIQTRLDKRLKLMAKFAQSQASLTSESQSQLHQVYSKLAGMVPQTQAKVQAFAAKNKSQQAGIKVISTFLEEKALGVIGSVAGTKPPPPPPEEFHELWVRIYPDDIFIRTHEPELTEAEISLAKRFWKMWWAATADRDLELAAWSTLCQALGSARASWVARQSDPRTVDAPLNKQRLQKRPSHRTAEAVRLTQLVYDNFLKPLPLEAASNVLFGRIDNALVAAVTNTLGQAMGFLAEVTEEQVFFYQKLQTVLVHAGSILNALIDRVNTLTDAEKANLQDRLAGLQQIITAFTAVNQRFEAMEPVAGDLFVAALPEPFVYPEILTKASSWSLPPQADLLPDRFVVLTMRGNNFIHAVVGEPIQDLLPVGLDPAKFEEEPYQLDEKGNLVVEEGLQWLVNYPAAVKAGMGITVPLTDEQADKGFDRLLVVGVKGLTPEAAQQRVESLFENHIYSPDGLDFLKTGTPTNNTHENKTPYKPGDDVVQRFELEIEQKKFGTVDKPFDRPIGEAIGIADGQLLGSALGLNAAVFQHATHSGQTQVGNALAMNRALWHATLGHHLEEMLDHLFTYDNIGRAEAFFLRHCLGRGFLPAIRVGSQPYGILPTTAFSRFRPNNLAQLPPLKPADLLKAHTPQEQQALENTLQNRFDMRLWQLLQMLRPVWEDLLDRHVKHFGNLSQGNNEDAYQQNFVTMLGLHATSLEEYVRYGVNAAKGPFGEVSDLAKTNFQTNDPFGPFHLNEKFKEHIRAGVFAPSYHFYDENPVLTANTLFWKTTDATYSRIFGQFDSSRIYQARFLKPNPRLKGPTVSALPLSGTDPIKPTAAIAKTYINWLLDATPDQILASNNWANLPSRSLLFMLLRQSLMQAYQEAGLKILQQEGLMTEADRRLLGSSQQYHIYNTRKNDKVFSTKWHFLLKDIDEVNGTRYLNFDTKPFYDYLRNNPVGGRKSVARYIFPTANNALFNNYANHGAHQAAIDKVKQVRDALTALGKIPTAELDILLAEHLDLSTYRLDAWLLGFVNRRLARQRSERPQGLLVGAFGWVENLRSDGSRKMMPETDLPAHLQEAGSTRPVYKDDDNEGFIHAPSINHGITAAILRSAYKANKNDQGAGSRLAINLSSERVRLALSLLEGLRNGLELGAILGFQFERGLHERYLEQRLELDKFIQPFRKRYPLSVPMGETADNKQPEYQSLVLNGQALLDQVFKAVNWTELDEEIPLREVLTRNNFAACPDFLKQIKPTPNAAELTAIIGEVDRMADAFDALGDLVMSESVYQIVQGNHVRAAAVLESLGKGRNIQAPQLVETPRAGTVVTQRVLWQLPVVAAAGPVAGWEGALPSLRAQAEPSLNAYLGRLLGPANRICGLVEVTSGEAEPQVFPITVADLRWQPIDYFFTAMEETALAQIIQFQYRQQRDLPDTAVVRALLAGRPADATKTVRTFYEMDYLLAQLRKLLGTARAAGADDFLDAPESRDQLNPGRHDAAALDTRLRAVLQQYKAWQTELEAEPWLQAFFDGTQSAEQINPDDAAVARMVVFLLRAQQEGVPNTVPGIRKPVPPDAAKPEEVAKAARARTTLLQQLLKAYQERRKRVAQAEKLLAPVPAAGKVRSQLEALTKAAKALFGKPFLVLPAFQLLNSAALTGQTQDPFHATSGLLRHVGGLAMQHYLTSIGRVREKMYALEMLGFGVESLGGPAPALRPAQLPYQEKDYWVGSEYPAEWKPGGDKLSLLIAGYELLTQPTQVGLFIDEWVEMIPQPEQTTGLVFHYDQPNATPPQSLLLAVAPEIKPRWDWDDLVYTLIDTLKLAKIRAVEPDHLEQSELAHVLPAIMAEVPPEQITGDANPLGVQVALDFAENTPG